ncbi:HEPN domain-containing protein [Candidatus Woesearchaeota archaeon]|nr:HEPN domain-containing protein [Candidatus Woesearchaeota archaeon]
MRKEIENWLEQAEADFDGAEYNFEGGKYYIAAFLCQQAVEKALKALFLYEKKGEVPQSHSLIYLATNTSAPEKFFSFLKELTPKFVDTRYPDASVDLPKRIYDKENTTGLLKKSKEVLIWISKKLKQ